MELAWVVAAPGILFRGSLKILIKKLEYIELSTKKKKKIKFNTWSFTIFFYKFSNFKLLYDSSLWVSIVNVGSYEAMIILFC